MKKTVFIAIVIVLILSLFYILINKRSSVPENSQNEIISPSATITISPTQKITSGQTKTKAEYIRVRDSKKIFLYSNLEERLTSNEAKAKKGCLYLLSGGFYGQDNKHIGLFTSEGNKVSDAISHSTFNGFFSINKAGNTEIDYKAPTDPRLAIQTGPIVFWNGRPVKLSLKNDENARRIVAAKNRLGEVIF